MKNQLEKILNFEGQEIKVKTDKGIELFNLSNSCRVLGITRVKKNGTIIVRWDSLKDRLSTIFSSTNKLEPQYIDELKQLLDDIDETDDRNSLYCSRYLTSLLAMESRNDKAMQYKSWLATLDESYSRGELTTNNQYLQLGNIADSMKLMSNMMNQIGQAFDGMQEFVQDSIQAKDFQIDQIKELVGFKNVNTKRIVNEIKAKLSEKLGKKIYASSNIFQEIKRAIFNEEKVIKWEDISVQNYNRVYAFVDELIEQKYGKAC